jgi:hypothetical protein
LIGIYLFYENWSTETSGNFQKEVNGGIFGRQEQGGGLRKIWNERKLREEFLKITNVCGSVLLEGEDYGLKVSIKTKLTGGNGGQRNCCPVRAC